jgi:hypothetical protein
MSSRPAAATASPLAQSTSVTRRAPGIVIIMARQSSIRTHSPTE